LLRLLTTVSPAAATSETGSIWFWSRTSGYVTPAIASRSAGDGTVDRLLEPLVVVVLAALA